MNAISPQDWQDQEDGRALRELREAYQGRRCIVSASLLVPAIDDYSDDVWEVGIFKATVAPLEDGLTGVIVVKEIGNTIAEAADACRAALRKRVA